MSNIQQEQEMNNLESSMVSDANELDHADSDIERFANMAEALENLYQTALPFGQSSSIIENNMLRAATVTLANKHGFILPPEIALESSDAVSPEQEAQGVLTNIKRFMLKIWKAIVDAFGRAYDWIVSLFKKSELSVGKLTERLKELQQSYEGKKKELLPDAPKELMGAYTSRLEVNNGTIKKAISNLLAFILQHGKLDKTALQKEVIQLADKENTKSFEPNHLESLVVTIAKTFDPLFPLDAPELTRGVLGLDAGSSELFPGNFRAYCLIPVKSETLGMFDFMISKTKGDITKTDIGIEVLEYDDIKHVLKDLTSLSEYFKNRRKVLDEFDHFRDGLDAATRTLERSVRDSEKITHTQESSEIEKQNSKNRLTAMRSILSFLPRSTFLMEQRILVFSAPVIIAATKWIDASLECYQVK